MNCNIIKKNNITEKIIDTKSREYQHIMNIYQYAMNLLLKKVHEVQEVLNNKMGYNVIKEVKSRLKSSSSIMNKLLKKKLTPTYENLIENIKDISGIRIICNFEDDIYFIKDILSKIDGINILEEKDYVKNPKVSGYRAYHLIVGIPLDDKNMVTIEIQIRTVLMDFWSNIEHQVKYKKKIDLSMTDSYKLTMYAKAINYLSNQMERIYRKQNNLLEN